ncbi:hypothetical protein LIER_41426 [Lithospermum erythrorhizon]|uniref:RNase H type-1 domain-containing protein n=1 Tax=Lithospermum erythrorhizon TaxID=34254 RepID=A0AAV3RAF4_LITER
MDRVFKPQKLARTIKWTPPPEFVYKLNTDGASKGNPGMAGCGGLIRDHLGNWVIGFARKIHWASSTCAELWALRDGLEMALHGNYSPIHIEMDSQIILNIISKPPESYNCYNAIVIDCRWLLSRFREEQIRHQFRDGNQVADALANMGCTMPHDFCTFRTPPLGVTTFVEFDRGGVGSTRVCNQTSFD